MDFELSLFPKNKNTWWWFLIRVHVAIFLLDTVERTEVFSITGTYMYKLDISNFAHFCFTVYQILLIAEISHYINVLT